MCKRNVKPLLCIGKIVSWFNQTYCFTTLLMKWFQIAQHHQWELCGQLVGVLQCVLSLTDSSPNSITLQHNKFAVRQIDKFLIVGVLLLGIITNLIYKSPWDFPYNCVHERIRVIYMSWDKKNADFQICILTRHHPVKEYVILQSTLEFTVTENYIQSWP